MSLLLQFKESQWIGKNIISVDQFTIEDLFILFSKASELRYNSHFSRITANNKIIGTLFYENSTRTHCSFQTAIYKLGGNVINLDIQKSSVQKGESIEDTIKTMECFCDALVVRHYDKSIMERILKVNTKPIINAGCSTDEHPTQALLDMYTIIRKYENEPLSGKVITFVGDLLNGRTVHSLVKLVAIYNMKINYIAPKELQIPNELVEKVLQINKYNIQIIKNELDDEVLKESDIIYVTRIQKERFLDNNEYDRLKNSFCITPEILNKCKKTVSLLHPLPRINEISIECDKDPRANYFEQIENGVFIRMALLSLILPIKN
jgi:aspartate carbamoyltransferase